MCILCEERAVRQAYVKILFDVIQCVLADIAAGGQLSVRDNILDVCGAIGVPEVPESRVLLMQVNVLVLLTIGPQKAGEACERYIETGRWSEEEVLEPLPEPSAKNDKHAEINAHGGQA